MVGEGTKQRKVLIIIVFFRRLDSSKSCVFGVFNKFGVLRVGEKKKATLRNSFFIC